MRKLRTTVGVEVYSRAFWLTFAVKAVLICLLVFGALSGLQQFEGKVFLWRLVTYPIAALVVPITWGLTGRRASYPYTVDILLTLPFLIDTVGNTLDLIYMTRSGGGTTPTISSTGHCFRAPSAPWHGETM